MKALSIITFASLLILVLIHTFMNETYKDNSYVEDQEISNSNNRDEKETLLSQHNRYKLDKIGNVINKNNANIDDETTLKIKTLSSKHDNEQDLKNQQALLEKSFMDQNSSIQDIKKLQNNLCNIKDNAKIDILNTEKWDAKLIYYLMIYENHTYNEINTIKSLSMIGITSDELNYIAEFIKEDIFIKRIASFKTSGGNDRTVASKREDNELSLAEKKYTQDENEEISNDNEQ